MLPVPSFPLPINHHHDYKKEKSVFRELSYVTLVLRELPLLAVPCGHEPGVWPVGRCPEQGHGPETLWRGSLGRTLGGEPLECTQQAPRHPLPG